MQKRAAPRARVPCAALRVPRSVQGRTGGDRAAQGTRALRSQAPRALRCARTVQRCAERRARCRASQGRRASRKRNYRGRNDRMRIEIVAKTRDEQMLLAWARSGGELLL